MIIQIRGTSGSGKSTVMRRVMTALGEWFPTFVPGRKRPLYYVAKSHPVIVLGHYESACGGCDTIGSAAAVYDLIKRTQKDDVVLCEGLLLSEDVKWSGQLLDLRVLFLDTPLDQCLRQIEGRRRAVGNDKPLNPANTTNRVEVIERARGKLEALGVTCRKCSPGKAPSIVLGWLKEAIGG